MAESVLKICRICLQQLGDSENPHFLNDDNDLMLLSKLLDFQPEIDLDFVQTPISCSRCTITIEKIHEFKKMWVQTERVIKNLKMQGKSFDNVINYVKNEDSLETIKEEFLEDKLKNEPLIVDEDCLQFNTDLPVCIEVPTKLSLNKRLRTHTEEKAYKCDVCDYRCSCKSDLKIHTCIHTGEKPYECNVCGYRCDYQSQLKMHTYKHTGEKPYKCDVCEYRSTRKSHLIKHTLVHTGEKLYKCYICDYSCPQKRYLKLHLQCHTEEKPYKCNECNYRFTQKSNLKTHTLTHTGEKPYKCDVCDYSCVRKDYLKCHLRLHTRKKAYKCDVCDYSCVQKDQLELHSRSHTGEKP